MEFSIKWKTKRSLNNFGILEINQLHLLKLMIKKVKNYPLLEKQPLKLLQKL